TRFTGTLTTAGVEFESTQTIRRELVRRVVALDPVIDEAFGESSQLRYHSPVLQRAVDGLLAALASWRAAALLLARSPQERARQEAGAVLARVPQELRSAPVQGEPARWIADPVGLRRICEQAVRRLVALPADTPSLRLLARRADQAYAAAMSFTVGTVLAAAVAAIIAFAVLPNTETFAAFSIAIGLVLIPAGALMAWPWQPVVFSAMAANFVPVLQPA